MLTRIPTMRKALLGLIVAAISLGAAATVVAKQGRSHSNYGHPSQMSPQQRIEFVLDRLDSKLDDLDATPEQRETLRAEAIGFMPRASEFHKARAPYKKEMAQIMLSDAPDKKRAHAIVDEVSDLSVTFAHDAADVLIRSHAVLDKKQRAQIARRFDTPKREFTGSFFIDRGLDRAMIELDATDDQQQLAEAKKEEVVKAAGTLVKDLYPLRDVIITQIRSDAPDAKKIHATIDAAALLFTEFGHNALDAALEFGVTLDDEQRQTIKNRMARRHSHHHAP